MQGRTWSGQIIVVVNQRSDGKLSNLRKENGRPFKDSDWPQQYGFGLLPAMGYVIGVDYLTGLVLPEREVRVNDTWTGSVLTASISQSVTGDLEHGTRSTFSVERAPIRYKYTLVGFVRWNVDRYR